MAERIPIKVAVSVLADLSLGIYRTPANALKELVSNAFDADATRVVMNTGFPHFTTMTCRDNGHGMTADEFRNIMKLIGGSIKRRGGREFTDTGRPIIGKIGIGILAVAQICRRFTIISSAKGSDRRFEAHVDFEGFAVEKAKEISLASEEAEEIGIGSYELYDDLPEDNERQYTRVILEDIDPGFKQKLSETQGPETALWGYEFQRRDPKTLLEFVKWLSETDARQISDYNRLIWELALLCPVPYLENGPVVGVDVMPDIRRRLLEYDFTLRVDGLELRKPILLPTAPHIAKQGEDFDVYDLEFSGIVDRRPLSFRGYIFWQRTAIMPAELRGLLVRIRNVAVGTYDRSLLDYPKAQGPRMTWLSGEVYVEEGLEQSLNVDRNSFRETDPHYLKLQEVLYRRLGGDKDAKIPGIFSDISRASKARNRDRRLNEDALARQQMIGDIEALWGMPLQIESSRDDSSVPMEVDLEKGVITIYERHQLFPRPRAQRRLLERVLIAYELANSVAASKNAVRKEFYRLLTGS
jgi:hypothetical protein